MTDDQLLRYSRHILLDEIGIGGQEALSRACVLIVGAGGLGCAAALYLAASGVGKLVLVDADTVDLTNLQRQIAHTTAAIGQLKVESLRDACLRINPHIDIQTHALRADATQLAQWMPSTDVVLDCTDNFATRHAINAACVAHRVALVSGSAIRFDAQLSVFDARRDDSACYACVFAPSSQAVDAACATMGVLSALVGMIGTMQAAQALALITNCTTPLVGQLLMVDARSFSFEPITISRNPSCTVCARH